ncbi:MAG: hypothetical protein QM770_10910 [Tepidisphaeraceae bacterium]
MATWIIRAVRKSDGKELRVKVEAPSAAAAEAKATAKGFMVESIDLDGALHVGDGAQVERPAAGQTSVAAALASLAPAVEEPEHDDRIDIAPSRPAAPTSPAPTAFTPAYATPGAAVGLPEYRGLVIASTVLRLFAFFYYAVAAIGVIVALVIIFSAVVAMMGPSTPPPSPSYNLRNSPFTAPPTPSAADFGILGLIGSLLPLLWAAMIGAFGAILHGLSAAATAMRDIARNSWQR